MDDNPVIYGLEDFQARTLVAQTAETEKINFIVGTQSLKNTNQVHLIEFDDDTGVVSKESFAHSAGEIWGLASSPQRNDIIATIYYNTEDYYNKCGASLWRLPFECSESSYDDPKEASVEHLCDLCPPISPTHSPNTNIESVLWSPESDSSMVSVTESKLWIWDVQEGGKMAKCVSNIGVESRGSHHLGQARWSPHQQATQIGSTFGSGVLCWDLRSMKETWHLQGVHTPVVRNLDFNPNKQYFIATCGDDCKTKIWDIRNSQQPLLILDDHSHWVWSVRFNPSYDQLVLTCSSDQRVMLFNLSSVSSQVSDSGSEHQVGNTVPNSVVYRCDTHEDSIYCVEWSTADFWTFASLSYDGRLVINKVPKNVKYKQFM